MNKSQTQPESLESLRAELELLRVREKHLQNDLAVTRHENEDATLHYLQTLSDLQKRNQELEELKNSLESLVEARTSELRESQAHLLHLQRVELIGALAGGIAHDFNNILFAIIGYAEMAAEDVADDNEAAEKIAAILKACNRAKDLVKHILNFSKQEKIENRPVLVFPIMQEAVRMLRASVAQGVEIRHVYETRDTMILGDPTELHQIIMNLGLNAADAIGEQSGLVEIRTSRVEPSDAELAGFPNIRPMRYVLMSVKDNGSGIEPAALPKLFTPFFTTKSTANGRGTGLGLAVAKSIIERYGGFIDVESEPGKGACFKVFIPELMAVSQPEDSDDEPIPGGNERVLFVDDEPGLSDVACAVLSSLGYDVTALASSAEALELFTDDPNRFDLAILDQAMPDISGLELARMLLRKRPDLPVLLCTGYSNALTAEQMKAAGLAALLYKPLVRRELAESIRSVLERASSASQDAGM